MFGCDFAETIFGIKWNWNVGLGWLSGYPVDYHPETDAATSRGEREAGYRSENENFLRVYLDEFLDL